MTKKSQYSSLLLIILFLALLYFITVFIQVSPDIFLGLVILWAIILPAFSYFHYKFIYFIALPSPIFGTWFLLSNLIAKYMTYSGYWVILTPFLSVLLVYAFHIVTRSSTMFWKVSKSDLSRSSIAAASGILMFFGYFALSPSGLDLGLPSEIFYFSIALLGYVAASMLYVNYHYRVRALSDRIGASNIQRKKLQIFARIEGNFLDRQKDVDILRYYFNESLFSFLNGDFERSIIWGYKVIREPTIVNPLNYVDDKREGKCALSEIRNTLEHSRREGHVDTNEIKRIIKGLYDDCLDLLEREFEFITKVADSEGSDHFLNEKGIL